MKQWFCNGSWCTEVQALDLGGGGQPVPGPDVRLHEGCGGGRGTALVFRGGLCVFVAAVGRRAGGGNRCCVEVLPPRPPVGSLQADSWLSRCVGFLPGPFLSADVGPHRLRLVGGQDHGRVAGPIAGRDGRGDRRRPAGRVVAGDAELHTRTTAHDGAEGRRVLVPGRLLTPPRQRVPLLAAYSRAPIGRPLYVGRRRAVLQASLGRDEQESEHRICSQGD